MNYLSRIHREEVQRTFILVCVKKIQTNCILPFMFELFTLCLQDYDFVLKGLARLLTNPLTQTYLPNSTKKIQFHQELLVLFWKLCDFNKVRD